MLTSENVGGELVIWGGGGEGVQGDKFGGRNPRKILHWRQ